jgi:hypothetical protein
VARRDAGRPRDTTGLRPAGRLEGCELGVPFGTSRADWYEISADFPELPAKGAASR